MVSIFILCVLLLAFVSAAETALTSLSQAKIRQIIESKKRRVQALKLWRDQPSRVLTTLLVGNNIAGTLGASIATVIADGMFDNFAIGIATGFTTFIMMVFGEITPKTFARDNAERLAPALMNILVPIYWMFSPVVYFMSGIVKLIGKIFGWKKLENTPFATQEEIAYMIRLGHQEGVLNREEGEMFESLIQFKDTIVKEVMVPRTRICTLEKSDNLSDIKSLIIEHGHSRWPVYDDNVDNIIGIFHAKDLLRASVDWTKHIRPAVFVPEMMKVGELLKEFRRGRAHLAVVVDEYGGTAGIISLEDVLEEIVGDIRDEYDKEEEVLLTQLPDNCYQANGFASIYDLGDNLDLSFPAEEDYETLAGFLIAKAGKMPSQGDEIEFQGWRFLVEKSDQKKIERVKICPILKES